MPIPSRAVETGLALFLAAAAGPLAAADPEDVVRDHDIRYAAAPADWHLGFPLANGELGAMVWGNGQPLVLTLDRYDLWDARTWQPDPLRYNYERWRRLVEEGRASEIREEFETKHGEARERGEHPSPTRLPLGRLEVRLGGGAEVREGVLRLSSAEAELRSGAAGRGGGAARAFVHATGSLILLDLEGPPAAGAAWSLVPARLEEGEAKRLERLGYEPARVEDLGDGAQAMRWGFGGDREVAAAVRPAKLGPERLVLGVAIRTARAAKPGPGTALDLALRDLDALAGLDAESWRRETEEHRSWWARFWAVSRVRVPDREIEALWYRGLYQLASLSRPGKYPVSLQGVWTRDGGLPPWAGDYHLDMNVQESYWPAYASNHLDLALPLYERFSANLPRYRRMCREFFGFDGCYTRCEQALDGSEIFGYATTNFWAGNGAWLAQHFWLHWRYTLDFEFLARVAHPFLRSAMDLYLGLLEKGEDGYYHLPITNSPEFHENLDSAWGKDDAGNLALVQFLAGALLEADRVLGREDPARERWRDVLANLAPLPGTTRDPATGGIRYRPNGQGGILVMAGRPYDSPHRHMTHLLAIYPLCLLRKGTSPEIDLLIDDSIENVLRRNEPIGDWAGWTFPWVSLLASHTGRRGVAVEMLRRFAAAHTYPNGLHENGDWRGLGTTRLRYRRPTVTVEGSIAAAAAVTDLLLQSDGGTLRLFPGCPEAWKEASFSGLRAEGAFVVSAARRDGRLASVRIASEKGSRLKIAGLPPGTRARREGGAEVAVEERAGTLEFATVAGEAYELVLPAGEAAEGAR